MFRSSTDPGRHGRLAALAGTGWELLPSRIWTGVSSALGRYLPFGNGHARGVFIPRLEVVEDDEGFHVDAELPGVDANDIDITLMGGTLTIRGEKKEEMGQEQMGVYCSERFFGPFSREVPLPRHVDVNRAEAVYDNGVLYISLPKAQGETGFRKIPIRCVQGA
jgi:HSP20 family molecular chaperone IbpA